jgi:hypothetical protein
MGGDALRSLIERHGEETAFDDVPDDDEVFVECMEGACHV